MVVRPRRLTSGQTRALGLGLIVIGAFLVWDIVVDARMHGSYTLRYSFLAPCALLVGPWLLATGTLGARTLPESPLWHRLVAAGLVVAGFAWGLCGFGETVLRWLA
jgi:hypothetical protein